MYIRDKDYTYIPDPHVEKNIFLTREVEDKALPTYKDAENKLPLPIWEGHKDAIDCYNKAWQIAFSNLRQPVKESGLISNFIDTAFNGFTFMWDSSFMMMFGKYAGEIFNFQRTLDNFYAKQHKDGFISREICETENGEQFHRHDPSSTGPNILAWCEWEYYNTTGDISRIKDVFDPLFAYYNWIKANRTWPNGLYWTTGWGCGMDNQPRQEAHYRPEFSHGHMVWLDATVQQIMSAKLLIKMAEILDRVDETKELQEEIDFLTKQVNELLWDEKSSYYYDMWRNGELNYVKTIGAYWTLIADIVPSERIAPFVAHLDNENEFKRPHRVPTLSADHPSYKENGDYWCGGVWAPTNYMVLKGLDRIGYNDLAYEIAENHVKNVVDVFLKTGTLWENYAPELVDHGNPAAKDFVGWTGIVPIAVLFEYVFGIRPNAKENKIVWYVNRTEKHGVMRYPFGNTTYDIICEARNKGEKPNISVVGDAPVTVELHWDGNVETLSF